jgi:large subunit ribosomal protein L9
MEVILREAIDRLGQVGEVVTVKDGYARNYLLPRKLAYLSTPGNVKVMKQEKVKIDRHEAQQREEAEKLRDALNGVEISIRRRVGEKEVLYGSVTSADIAEAIEAKGFKIDKRKILIDENLKQIGEFTIPIRLFTEVIAEVKLRVEPEGGAPESVQAAQSPENLENESPETVDQAAADPPDEAESE